MPHSLVPWLIQYIKTVISRIFFHMHTFTQQKLMTYRLPHFHFHFLKCRQTWAKNFRDIIKNSKLNPVLHEVGNIYQKNPKLDCVHTMQSIITGNLMLIGTCMQLLVKPDCYSHWYSRQCRMPKLRKLSATAQLCHWTLSIVEGPMFSRRFRITLHYIT